MQITEPKDIFISYKSDDVGNLFSHRLKNDLENMGFSVFLAPEHTHSDFREKIRKAVLACTDLILIVSPACLEKLMGEEPEDWIRWEVELAKKNNKNIIPIMIGGAQFPRDASEMPESLYFLPFVDNIQFPQEPEKYYEAPLARLMTRYILSKPNSGGLYRDVCNSNSDYNPTENMQSLIRAAENGSVEAMYELGIMYWYGCASETGVFSDTTRGKAAAWLKKVSGSGHELAGHAENILASMYYCGEIPGEEQSYEKAFHYHTIASKTDVFSAIQRAGMLQRGCGCEFDFQETLDAFKDIIDAGDNKAQLELAKFYERFGYFREAADQYEKMTGLAPEAAYQLGMLYKRGVLQDPPKPDYRLASHYLGIAADNYPLAAFEYAMLFFSPSGKMIHKDFRIAEKYFKIAADYGITEAQYTLGYMYEHGYIERSIEKAISYFEAAVKQGHSLAAKELALLYQMDGPERNYEKAYHNAVIAASHGVATGALILGNLLFYGRGCKADMNKALQYYEYAYQHGHYAAKIMIDKIADIQKG